MRKVIEYANPPLYQPAAIAVAVTDFSLLFLSFLCMVSISKKSLYYVGMYDFDRKKRSFYSQILRFRGKLCCDRESWVELGLSFG